MAGFFAYSSRLREVIRPPLHPPAQPGKLKNLCGAPCCLDRGQSQGIKAKKFVRSTLLLRPGPVSGDQKPYDQNSMRLMIHAYAKKKATPHIFRHSCATHLLKNNANLRHVQELLGHGSLATTEKYVHLTITDLKEAHRKFHPKERSLH